MKATAPSGASRGAASAVHSRRRRSASTAAQAQGSRRTMPLKRVAPASAASTPAISHRRRSRASRQPALSASSSASEYSIENTTAPGKKQNRATPRSARSGPRTAHSRRHSTSVAARPPAVVTTKAAGTTPIPRPWTARTASGYTGKKHTVLEATWPSIIGSVAG